MKDIVETTKIFDALKYSEGTVKLWGHYCFIQPIIGVLVKDQLTKEITEDIKMKKINYFTEKFQALMGMKILAEKFGYAKTYQEKKDLLLFFTKQSDLLGYGKTEWIKIDFKQEIFILRLYSTYALTYKEVKGLSKEPVDFWCAGAWAAQIEYILNKKVACLEISCIAQGKPCCEFVIKPVEKWDSNDEIVKKNSYAFEDIHLDMGNIRF